MLPNFLCIGAQKAGTSSLYNLLKQHPDIYLPEKELHFFDKKTEYEQGKTYYEQNFEGHNGEKIIGEFTPDYSVYSYCPKRIKETLGKNIKIIFILRQPVKRAYSQYNHYKVLGSERSESFEDVLSLNEQEKIASEYESWDNPKYYVGRGLYFEQLNRYLEEFDESNILIVLFEDLISRTGVELKKIQQFLDLSPHKNFELNNSNQTQIPKNKVSKNLLHLSRRSASIKIINVFKSLIPNSLFKKLKKTFFTSLRNLPEKLDDKKVNELTNTYFLKDIKKLENRLDIDLKIWCNSKQNKEMPENKNNV